MAGEILQLNGKFCEGAFAVVAISWEEGIARKLFKRASEDAMHYQRRPWENDIRRATFQSEVDGYKAVMSSADARRLVPEFKGIVNISRVLNAAGNDISDGYLLDCCFAMELLAGNFRKLFISGKPIVPEDEANRVVRTLREVGIHYLIDASVRVDPTKEKVEKIIDFALRDAYQEEGHKKLFAL
jgi:hypothetical protein